MEVRGENYFLSSPWEYVIVDKMGKNVIIYTTKKLNYLSV